MSKPVQVKDPETARERRSAGWVHGFYGRLADHVWETDKDYAAGYASGQRKRLEGAPSEAVPNDDHLPLKAA